MCMLSLFTHISISLGGVKMGRQTSNKELSYQAEVELGCLMDAYRHNMTEFIGHACDIVQEYYDRNLMLFSKPCTINYTIYYKEFMILNIVYKGETFRLAIGEYVRFTADRIVFPDKNWFSMKVCPAGRRLSQLSKYHVADFIFPDNIYVKDEFKLTDIEYDRVTVGDADGLSEKDKLAKVGYVTEYTIQITRKGQLPDRKVRHTKSFVLNYDIMADLGVFDKFYDWVKPLKVSDTFNIYLIMDTGVDVGVIKDLKSKIQELFMQEFNFGIKSVTLGSVYNYRIEDVCSIVKPDMVADKLDAYFDYVIARLGK